MSKTETIFFTSPDPKYGLREGVRVAPNRDSFPTDATVWVETDSHYLEFDIVPKDDEEHGHAIRLVGSFPPLPEINEGERLIIEDDIVKRDQEFRLVSTGSSLAVQAFVALRILSNVEGLVFPTLDAQA